MKGKSKAVISIAAAMILALTVKFVIPGKITDDKITVDFPDSVMVTFDFSSAKKTEKIFFAGYSYDILNRFCSSNGTILHTRLASKKESWADSLDVRSTDIVILPYSDSIHTDSLHICLPIDSAGCWMFRRNDRRIAHSVSKWMEKYRKTPEYDKSKALFLNAQKSGEKDSAQDHISPYDSLIKVYADTLGWDWRLLSAVIFTESGFRIEVQSAMGASGLMQVMPRIAERYGWKDLLDPENSIRAGTHLLREIAKRYRFSDKSEEKIKYVLSSYNAGPFKVLSCIENAKEMGLDTSDWDTVADLVPTDPLDSASVSRFLSGETTGYVRRVLYKYKLYQQMFPEQ